MRRKMGSLSRILSRCCKAAAGEPDWAWRAGPEPNSELKGYLRQEVVAVDNRTKQREMFFFFFYFNVFNWILFLPPPTPLTGPPFGAFFSAAMFVLIVSQRCFWFGELRWRGGGGVG